LPPVAEVGLKVIYPTLEPICPLTTDLISRTALSVVPAAVLYEPKLNVNFASQLSTKVKVYLPLGLSVAAPAVPAALTNTSVQANSATTVLIIIPLVVPRFQR
jgi:hypothetical protein